MRRTLLSLTLCALPTAAAIVLLSSRRAARDREEDALDEVARSERRLADALYQVDVALADAAQARAAESAANEREAAEERGHAMQLAQVEARGEAAFREMMASAHRHAARAEAAEKARAQAVADLDTLRAEWATPPGMTWKLMAVPVAPVVKEEPPFGPPCIMCDGDSRGYRVWANDDEEDRVNTISCCRRCEKAHWIEDIRHAARTASATPVAAVAEPALPWDYCPKCKEQVGDDMRTGEWRDGSEGTCDGCDTVYHAVWYGDDFWRLHEYDAPDSDDDEDESDEPDAEPAPTQDDLDDAAVRLKLADGPAHWMKVVVEWRNAQGDVLDRFIAAQNRLRLVRTQPAEVELWALPDATSEATS